ncbi:MAG: hypothetical protein ACRDRT_06235 [Pseudonocardiaceae bacterium]
MADTTIKVATIKVATIKVDSAVCDRLAMLAALTPVAPPRPRTWARICVLISTTMTPWRCAVLARVGGQPDDLPTLGVARHRAAEQRTER